MNHIFFRSQMDHLISTYSAKPFEGYRMTQIEQIVSRLTDAEFKKIVNHFISNSRQPPLPNDFKEAVRRELASRPRSPDEEFNASREPKCNKCCDAGVFEIQHDRTRMIALVRCTCKIGRDSFHRDLPVWDAFKVGDQFTPLYMGDNGRHLIWRPDGGWRPDHGISQLDEKMAIWKLKLKESLEFWAAFKGRNDPDGPQGAA